MVTRKYFSKCKTFFDIAIKLLLAVLYLNESLLFKTLHNLVLGSLHNFLPIASINAATLNYFLFPKHTLHPPEPLKILLFNLEYCSSKLASNHSFSMRLRFFYLKDNCCCHCSP